MKLKIWTTCLLVLFIFQSCVSNYVRLPNSVAQVYSNTDIQQALMLAAQNNILINIPEATTREFEKSEIDHSCREIKEPLWSEKLSVYLNEFRKRPELLSKFHVIELKRADKSAIDIQKDLDGAVTLSIQFAKVENYGKVSFQTKLPCKGSVAEYFGRDIVKTDYTFPAIDSLVLALQALPDKKEIPRFQFANDFLIYLAERGTMFKFTHEMSFEKTGQGKYIMAELLNKLAEETKQPFRQHTNYWFKQINENSKQAQLIQMFAAIQDKELKAGVRVDTRGEISQKVFGDSDLTYLYITYTVENDAVNYVSLTQLENCLQNFTQDMSGLKLRKPAASDRESYLKPGYACNIK
ncbi:MAG: hypothetical protein ACXWPX_04380 [Pseudobdellovibrio sp.]